MQDVSILMAFAAGAVSFLSPCVLPLVPGYVSFISGISIQKMIEQDGQQMSGAEKRTVLINAAGFIIGFSAVFILLGASATWIGSFLSFRLTFFTKLAGIIIILFGIIKLGLLRPLFLLKERRFPMENKRGGIVGTFIIGAAFAFGWTPCIGPILAGILAYAGTMENIRQGLLLLTVYAAGLGLPFLLTAIGVNRFFRWFHRIKRYIGVLEKAVGVVMIIIGVLIYTDRLILIPAYLPFLNQFAL